MSDKTNLTTGTIFDEKGYDEMQKRENHEIGFRLFRIMFFIVLLFAFILVMVCGDAGNVAGMIISLGLVAITYGFYIVYAYMTVKRGIMNPKFAKSWSSKWVIPVYIALILLWSYKIFRSLTGECDISDIALYSIWIIILTGNVAATITIPKQSPGMPSTLTTTVILQPNYYYAMKMRSNSSSATTSGNLTVNGLSRLC